jgi:hypothetical protein
MNKTKYTQGTLQSRLQIKAGMIAMGERIEWGSDSALMWEAAAKIEVLEKEVELLKAGIKMLESTDACFHVNPHSMPYAAFPPEWCKGCNPLNCSGCNR